jgi:hypothetical protein
MRRLVLLLALTLAPAAQANDRAESEARLAALAEKVIPVLAAALPAVEGMVCTPATIDPGPTNRLLFPRLDAECLFSPDGALGGADVSLIVSASTSSWYLDGFAELAETGAEDVVLVPDGAPRAARWPSVVQVALSPSIAATANGSGSGRTEAIDRVTEALLAIDTAPLETLPEVRAHVAALADHRALLLAHRAGLETVLKAAIADAVITPPMDGIDATPDFMLFAAMPLAQTDTVDSGVKMFVRLTTSSYALETAAANGQFFGNHAEGEVSRGGVFHDRGRVQVYLQDTGLTALIDSRAVLSITVTGKAPGTDPIAAMEAVLARVAAADFSGY